MKPGFRDLSPEYFDGQENTNSDASERWLHSSPINQIAVICGVKYEIFQGSMEGRIPVASSTLNHLLISTRTSTSE